MQTSIEIEAKFPVSTLTGLEVALGEIGGRLVSPRTFESNWRFDTPDGELTRTGRVLRVRQEKTATLTYKERTEQRLTRREIELDISSSTRAAELFEALGYHVVMLYEKYRLVYQLGEVEIMLDELPFGCFVEIEGPREGTIKDAAEQLGLDWGAGIDLSYMDIFDRLRQAAGLGMQQITFSEFEGYELDTITVLGLRDALDRGAGEM